MTKNDNGKVAYQAKDSRQIEPSPTGRTRIRLKSARDVCKYIASCIRRAEREGGETTYYKRVMMAAMLVKALEVGDLETRLEQLEVKLGDKKDESL